METTLVTIETSAKTFAADRRQLVEAVTELNAQIEDLKRRAMPRLKRLIATAAESHALLYAQIDGARPLFTSPRTILMHGIRLGLRKGSGKLEWDDPDQVVRLVEKYLPDQAEVLIKTKKSPIKAALEELDVTTLKKVGCRVQDTGDQVTIKPADSEVDKIVTALLASAQTDTQTDASEPQTRSGVSAERR